MHSFVVPGFYTYLTIGYSLLLAFVAGDLLIVRFAFKEP